MEDETLKDGEAPPATPQPATSPPKVESWEDIYKRLEEGWKPHHSPKGWSLRKTIDGKRRYIYIPKELQPFCETLWGSKKGQKKPDKNGEGAESGGGTPLTVSPTTAPTTAPPRPTTPVSPSQERLSDVANKLVQQLRQAAEDIATTYKLLSELTKGEELPQRSEPIKVEEETQPTDVIEALKQQISSLEENRRKLKSMLEELGFKIEDMYLHKDEVEERIRREREKWEEEALDDRRVQEIGNIVRETVSKIIGLFQPAVQAWADWVFTARGSQGGGYGQFGSETESGGGPPPESGSESGKGSSRYLGEEFGGKE